MQARDLLNTPIGLLHHIAMYTQLYIPCAQVIYLIMYLKAKNCNLEQHRHITCTCSESISTTEEKHMQSPAL